MGKTLLPYQKAGAKGLRKLKRGILADDMGLGKTIQAIAAAAQKTNQHILIITLNGLQNNWRAEICDLLGQGQDIEVYDGKQVIGTSRWTIIHYEAARLERNAKVLCDRRWDVLIVDEAHRCKSHKARTKAGNATNYGIVNKLSYRSRELYLLTGTPMRENPADVWALLHFIDKKKYSSFWRWIPTYVIYEQTYFGKKASGYQNLDLLSRELSQYMIRRRKCDVIHDLPPKRVHTIKCGMSDKQSKIYTQMLNEYVAEVENNVFVTAPAEVSRLMRLRQIATDANCLTETAFSTVIPSGKIQTLEAMVQEICVEQDEKVVIFSNWARVVASVERTLRKYGCVTYTGDTPKQQRELAVKQFQDNPKVKVFIATIGAAGTGLTLTAASKMIFTDRAWTPDDNAQAEDRIYARMNDIHGADIYKLITADTVDETIEAYINDKEVTVDTVISNIKSAVLATNK